MSRVHQIRTGEAFGEPIKNLGENIVCFVRSSLFNPQSAEAYGGAKFERLRQSLASAFNSRRKARFSLLKIMGAAPRLAGVFGALQEKLNPSTDEAQAPKRPPNGPARTPALVRLLEYLLRFAWHEDMHQRVCQVAQEKRGHANLRCARDSTRVRMRP
jgi:hypothetical protein